MNVNTTTCYLGRGLPRYFLYKGVATLGLAVMEIKRNIFLNETRFRHSNGPITSQSKEGAKSLYVTRNEGKDSCDRKKTTKRHT